MGYSLTLEVIEMIQWLEAVISPATYRHGFGGRLNNGDWAGIKIGGNGWEITFSKIAGATVVIEDDDVKTLFILKYSHNMDEQ